MANEMTGKTVLVTGANQGIGKATAIALGEMGASVLLLCRNAEKGRAALAEVKAAGAPRAELIVADLASQAEVRRAAADVRNTTDRLDVLVNNAGVLVPSRRTTVDGIEETIAINHLAPFLLTKELLDLLVASAPARIVNVSSQAHRSGKIAWDDIQLTQGYAAFRAYGQSKLANILFTHGLAARLDPSKVTANSLHPGVVASGFGETYGGPFAFVIKIAKPFMITNEDGAKTSVYLASSPDVAAVTGKYFIKCKEARSNRASYEEGAADRLWTLSESLVAPRSDRAVA
jgi:NAD(P)-dependent dehydrogenase (short-subunit alcohol dehydrogenase family)